MNKTNEELDYKSLTTVHEHIRQGNLKDVEKLKCVEEINKIINELHKQIKKH